MIMSVTYDIKIKDSNDPYILKADEALDGMLQAGIPGAFLVDLIPILKYVPAWFPGAGFKRKASHWSKVNADVVEKPFQFVAEQVVMSLSARYLHLCVIMYIRNLGLQFLL